jgi:hypothetical protein
MSGLRYRLLIAGAVVAISWGEFYTRTFAQEVDYGPCGTTGNIAESADTAGYYVCDNTHLWKWRSGSFPRPAEGIDLEQNALVGIGSFVIAALVLFCFAQTLLIL